MSQEEIWAKQEEMNLQVEEGEQRRKNKKRVITNPNQLTGHWSEQEHNTYLDFLNMHRTVMESQDQKKTSKIFKLMSETIGTRSPSQCRSHHQKFNPFVHSVKKRQKGVARKRKENGNQDKVDKYNENGMLQQFMVGPPFYQQQQGFQDYQFQFPQMPYMFQMLDQMGKDEDKINIYDQQQLYYQQYLMAQQQLQQQMDEKNLFCYFMQPQQVQMNLNYYPPQVISNISDEMNIKDNQFDEQ
ncbi:unnamed protein product (macronuclear) [Paramecium tetraurelia]|uniref:Myb-like domain-containing protein n=1 Tax=Paramecium tetraurelia TaxID=5888 RepID=A0DL48_PARTE|nr:uncharacterized protein GSPATT00018082001 [Paramecium tetraurelia]CAK83765.1 unnamed protein product [Paramecium tetraurelia]|eukprot:XP_001451162.1 hypothetical protein (macronuclear) [Paramecium tetraurelia strain d4-2]